jgi:hypothetical protein
MKGQRTYEEIRKELDEKLASGYFNRTDDDPEPTVSLVSVPVPLEDAKDIANNAENVGLTYRRRDDGVNVIVKPMRNPLNVTVMVDQVTGVDAYGRPVYLKSGAIHEYNPLDALKRGRDW